MQRSSLSSSDITRTTLAVVFIAVLIIATAWIVRPFASAFLWATMVVISTWPVLLWLQARLGGRRGLATTVMTIALLLVLVIPMTFLIGAVIGNMDRLDDLTKAFANFTVPPPPEWVARIPLQGPKLFAKWQLISEEGHAALAARAAPYAGAFVAWFAAQMGSLGGMILQFLLTVIISAVLYSSGEGAAQGVRRFAHRLAGENGDRAAVLAANTVRGVAMGVLVTAAVQTGIAGIGLAISSVPGAALLGAACLILCLAQLGPGLVMIPVVIWKFYSGDILWGSVLLVFTLVAGLIDNFLKPVLIRKGADLPLSLIFVGVLGGIIGLGVMGIFIGPVVLAVAYALVKEWVETGPELDEDAITNGGSVEKLTTIR